MLSNIGNSRNSRTVKRSRMRGGGKVNPAGLRNKNCFSRSTDCLSKVTSIIVVEGCVAKWLDHMIESLYSVGYFFFFSIDELVTTHCGYLHYLHSPFESIDFFSSLFPPSTFFIFFFFSSFSVSTETEHFVDKFKRSFFQLRNKGLGHDEEPAGMKKYKWRCEREARLHFALSCASFHFFRQGSTARAVLIRHSSVFSSSWLSVMKFHRNFCLQKEKENYCDPLVTPVCSSLPLVLYACYVFANYWRIIYCCPC